MIATEPTAPSRPLARPYASFQMRADVRLFRTSRELACQKDPELFFEPRTRRRAIKRCTECPFRGRCGYNAVATGATHGIWGGILLPGCYPRDLKPLYAALAAQFDERRITEVGDVPVAPLPDLDDDEEDEDAIIAGRLPPVACPAA